MFTALSWPHRLFLIAVSLAAIGPYLSVSLGCSVILLAYMAWDSKPGRRAGAGPVLRVTERPVIAGDGAPPPPSISV